MDTIRRIIIIDDNPNIFNDFKTIFLEDNIDTELDELTAEYFGKQDKKTPEKNVYELEYAPQGKEGVEKVKEALLNNTPFALAFVDMEMPPGWDGLETTANIWKEDPDVQIVICSAYSDHTYEEILSRFGYSDKLLLLKKPFASAEISQLAGALTEKWLLSKQAALKMSEIEKQVEQRTLELEKTNQYLQQEIIERKQAEEILRLSNQKILEQQKSVIEEERLKVLLQMAGATAYELNQPLFALLDNIQTITSHKDDPQKIIQHISYIENIGKELSAIVKKIQTIHHDELRIINSESTTGEAQKEVRILSIEDSDIDFTTHKAMLRQLQNITLDRAKCIKEGIQQIENNNYDLIFMDYMLPDGTGFEFLEMLKNMGNPTPVIAITGQGDEMVASQLIQSGAYDYLPKGKTSKNTFSRIISNTLEKAQLKKEIHKAREKMARMSAMDELTGLFNRHYFKEALEREISRARRHKINLILGIMDLDHFKRINDTYGHLAGDMVLSSVGKLLLGSFRKDDILCRYGGEEFALILPFTQINEAFLACERFRKKLFNHEFKYNEHQFQMTTSIGIAQYNDEMTNPAKELIELADNSLYQAKNEGRNRVLPCPQDF